MTAMQTPVGEGVQMITGHLEQRSLFDNERWFIVSDDGLFIVREDRVPDYLIGYIRSDVRVSAPVVGNGKIDETRLVIQNETTNGERPVGNCDEEDVDA